MSGTFTSPFGANTNPFGGNQPQMQSLAEEDENDPRTPPTAFSGPFGGDASADTSSHPDNYPAQYNFNRRTSVSAESLKPSADTYDNWSPPFHEKTRDQLDRLKKAIESNFLFRKLEDEQSSQILGALVEKPIPAKGIKVKFYFHIGPLIDVVD